MPRFNMLERLLHDSHFEDFFAAMTGGSSGHDHLIGTTSGNVLFAGRDESGGKPVEPIARAIGRRYARADDRCQTSLRSTLSSAWFARMYVTAV